MEGEMEVDTRETRGLKRAAEDKESPQKPKRIRVSTPHYGLLFPAQIARPWIRMS